MPDGQFAGLSEQDAATWIARWDTQQERYVTDRDQRFAVITAAVEAVAGPSPLVLDLGCGPGSLGMRLLSALPDARIVGVDADPVLLALGQAARQGLVFTDIDLKDPTWADQLGLEPGSVDAVVSTTALHWLPSADLASVVAACAGLLRPGGIWLDGDHIGLPSGTPGLAQVALAMRDAAEQAVQVGDTWEQWWSAALADPALVAAAAARSQRHAGGHPYDECREPTYEDYLQALTAAGFAEIGELWRRGDDVVLAALR